MGIKSLEELRQLREQYKGKTSLRHGGDEQAGGYIEILVGMATCGIAAGARETLNEIVKELSDRSIENVRVIPVGCLGFCQYEPTIGVNIPGSKGVVYGHVKKENVKVIIDSHIINKTPVESMAIEADLSRA